MAATYHQLGITAQDRGRLDEAADWSAKALAIFEELGDRPRTASTYHQLSTIARNQGRLAEAEAWSARALTITADKSTSHDRLSAASGLVYPAANFSTVDGS